MDFFNKVKDLAQDKNFQQAARAEYEAIQKEQGDSVFDKIKSRLQHRSQQQNDQQLQQTAQQNNSVNQQQLPQGQNSVVAEAIRAPQSGQQLHSEELQCAH